jgi:hypothetical protein
MRINRNSEVGSSLSLSFFISFEKENEKQQTQLSHCLLNMHTGLALRQSPRSKHRPIVFRCYLKWISAPEEPCLCERHWRVPWEKSADRSRTLGFPALLLPPTRDADCGLCVMLSVTSCHFCNFLWKFHRLFGFFNGSDLSFLRDEIEKSLNIFFCSYSTIYLAFSF